LDVSPAIATQSLADQQDDAVDREEDRRGEWLGEEHSQFVLQQEPGDPDGHRGDGEHEEQSVVRIGVEFIQMPERRDTGARYGRELTAQSAKEGDPGLAVVDRADRGPCPRGVRR
jgi:hypothetical protein